MTRSKVACLALVTAAALAPVAVVKSQSTATAVEPLVDFGDPLLAPLVRRGPVNSDELGRAVRAYLAQGLDEEAAQIIAAYLDPRERSSPLPGENISVEPATACGYCVEQLAFGESPAQAAQELKAVLAALESLEHKAHATRDGNLFVGLAVALEKVDTATGDGLGLSLLLNGLATGQLNDDTTVTAAELLGRRGWYEPAKALLEPLKTDPASSVPPETVQAWVDYFDFRMRVESDLKTRLISGQPDGDVSEYVPIYKGGSFSYPDAAQGATGSVIVQFTVTEQGRTDDVEILESSNPVFDEPALEVARQFRYAPRLVNGAAVAVEGVRNRIAFEPSASR